MSEEALVDIDRVAGLDDELVGCIEFLGYAAGAARNLDDALIGTLREATGDGDG